MDAPSPVCPLSPSPATIHSDNDDASEYKAPPGESFIKELDAEEMARGSRDRSRGCGRGKGKGHAKGKSEDKRMGKSTDVSKGNAGNSKGKSQGQGKGKGKISVVPVTQVSQPDGTEWHRMEAVVEFTVLTYDVSRVSGPAKHFSEARAIRPPRVLALANALPAAPPLEDYCTRKIELYYLPPADVTDPWLQLWYWMEALAQADIVVKEYVAGTRREESAKAFIKGEFITGVPAIRCSGLGVTLSWFLPKRFPWEHGRVQLDAADAKLPAAAGVLLRSHRLRATTQEEPMTATARKKRKIELRGQRDSVTAESPCE